MRVIAVNSIKVICAAVSAAVLGTAGTSVQAFKPEYESHGHTMITQSVLGSGGYSFSNDLTGPLTVPRFRFQYSTAAVDTFAYASAIKHIVLGVQSRDWGLTTLNFCSNDAPYRGVPTSVSRNDISVDPSDGIPVATKLCVSEDVNTEDGHFDNDNFFGSMKSLIAHLDKSIEYARVWVNSADRSSAQAHRERIAARIMFGKAVHTLQDFYAHSNWVEKYGSTELATFITDYVLRRDSFNDAIKLTLATQEQRRSGAAFPVGQGGGMAGGSACPANTSLSYDGWDKNDGNFLTTTFPLNFISTAAWWDSLVGAVGYVGAASDLFARTRCDHGVSDDAAGLSGVPPTKKFSGIAKDMPGWPPNPTPHGRVTGAGVNLDESYKDAGGWSWPNALPNEAKFRAEYDASRIHLLASFAAARHTKLLLETFVEYVK